MRNIRSSHVLSPCLVCLLVQNFVVQLVRKLTIVRVLSLYFQEKVFLQLFMRWSSLLRRGVRELWDYYSRLNNIPVRDYYSRTPDYIIDFL